MSIAEYAAARHMETSVKSPQDRSKTVHVESVDVTEKARRYGDRAHLMLTGTSFQAKEDNGKYSDYALVLRRKVDSKGHAQSTTLEVRSEVL